MILLGLTGSIAMGKSTVAQMFAGAGWPVFDADAAVHDLYRSDFAHKVEAQFPGVLVGGAVDRKRLADQALGKPEAIQRLEALVHPAVGEARKAFLARAFGERRRGVALDIPLLFETGGDRACDVVVVVSAGETAQRERALLRPGMSAEKLDAILARQTPDGDKRRRAHFVVDTATSLEDTRKQVEDLIRALIGAPGSYRG